jgi:hypothetical protein
MARVDDYIAALRLAREKLAALPAEDLPRRSGFDLSGAGVLRVPFLTRTYRVGLPGFGFDDEAAPGAEIPLQEQVLILHYLLADPPPVPADDWVAYREIPGAAFYFGAFVKRAIDPLKKAFGQDPGRFREAAGRLHGVPVALGDAGFTFPVFPKVPLRLILHAGDEEFPAEANILFARGIGEVLPPEDVAWLAGMLVYRLMAVSRAS